MNIRPKANCQNVSVDFIEFDSSECIMAGRLFTSESVTSGHPDKICDAISDAIVDACISVDPNARVAVETCVKGTPERSYIFLAGEVTLKEGVEKPDYCKIARDTAAEIGYVNHQIGMDATSNELCDVQVHITTQAKNIESGVDIGGAGDQGIMFGFACNETEEFAVLKGRYFPVAAALAQRLTRRLTIVREEGILNWARPDGKSQVTVEYDEEGMISRVHTVVIAIQHDSSLKDQFGGDVVKEHEFVKNQIQEKVIEDAIPKELLAGGYKLVVNGTGRFADPGGPHADAGLTGRKIIVDTYGGMGRHGGGAFSGKDPSKVDRSGAYAARWAAKHLVAAGLCDKCEIQLGYVIGVAEPVSLNVDCFGTEKIPVAEIEKRLDENFDFRPNSIIEKLDLLRPIYLQTSSGGHFGRTSSGLGIFPWEKIDSELISALVG